MECVQISLVRWGSCILQPGQVCSWKAADVTAHRAVIEAGVLLSEGREEDALAREEMHEHLGIRGELSTAQETARKVCADKASHYYLGSVSGKIRLVPPLGLFPMIAFDTLPIDHAWKVLRLNTAISALSWFHMEQVADLSAEAPISPRGPRPSLFQEDRAGAHQLFSVSGKVTKRYRKLAAPIAFMPGEAWDMVDPRRAIDGLAAAIRAETSPSGDIVIGLQGDVPETRLVSAVSPNKNCFSVEVFPIPPHLTWEDPFTLWRYTEPQWEIIQTGMQLGAF